MLDQGAKHFQLRQLDMPRNFFSGNNSVAEYGHLPTNFLLGVSTPVSDIEFRQQMRSRLGEPITIAGNPPVKFASTLSESENETHMRPGFPIFLTRVFLNDLFSQGTLPITEGLIWVILYVCLLRLNGHPIINAIIAAILTEVGLVLLCVAIKKLLVGRDWGTDHATQFWSWRHFAYFFAQDCYFSWCRWALGLLTGTILANSILRWMGCQIGRRTIVVAPLQCFDWNAVNFGNDCVIDGHPQFHTFENMILKVKRTQIHDGCAIGVGSTVMGGTVIERDTTVMPLSLVLKEMNLPPATYGGSPAELVSGTSLSAGIHDATRSKLKPHVVDNTDWLKAAAIILVLVGHFGYFFIEDDLWWSLLGRFAAPIFFFLVGYAKSSTIPLHSIGLGVALTSLDSANADWEWVAPNILELRTHSLCISLYTETCAALSLGIRRRPHFRAYRGPADSGATCRLWCRGVAMGFARPPPSPICRPQIGCQSGRRGFRPLTTTAAEETDRGSTAVVDLRGGCGCVRLAGTIGIRVSSDRAHHFHSGGGCNVRYSVSIRARPQPPSLRNDRRRTALIGRHTGNLCDLLAA
jgi:hypothetical protein